jgi:hypothetical protein
MSAPRRWAVVATLAVAALAPVRAAIAQNCTASPIPASCSPTARTVSLDIRVTARVTVTPTSASFGNPSPNDFNQGYTQILGHTIEVKANLPWQVAVRGTQNLFTAVGGGARGNKPRGDLLFATNPGGPYTAMPGTTAGTAIVFATGTATASTLISLYYRLTWVWTLDTAGTYTLPITLTVTAP